MKTKHLFMKAKEVQNAKCVRWQHVWHAGGERWIKWFWFTLFLVKTNNMSSWIWVQYQMNVIWHNNRCNYSETQCLQHMVKGRLKQTYEKIFGNIIRKELKRNKPLNFWIQKKISAWRCQGNWWIKTCHVYQYVQKQWHCVSIPPR